MLCLNTENYPVHYNSSCWRNMFARVNLTRIERRKSLTYLNPVNKNLGLGDWNSKIIVYIDSARYYNMVSNMLSFQYNTFKEVKFVKTLELVTYFQADKQIMYTNITLQFAVTCTNWTEHSNLVFDSYGRMRPTNSEGICICTIGNMYQSALGTLQTTLLCSNTRY